MAGKTSNVHFIDDRLSEKTVDRLVFLPIKEREICYDTLHRSRSIITGDTGCGPAVIVSNRNSFAVRIDQDFLRIEALTGCRITRAVSPIPIQLARFDSGKKNMPVVRGAISNRIEGDGLGGNTIVSVVEEDQLHTASACREDAEIRSVRGNGCA